MANNASAIETATADHAVAAFTNCTATIDSTDVDGIFDAPYTEIAGMGLTPPTLMCADDVVVEEGSTVVINDTTNYEVMTIEPDGTGLQRLILRAV